MPLFYLAGLALCIIELHFFYVWWNIGLFIGIFLSPIIAPFFPFIYWFKEGTFPVFYFIIWGVGIATFIFSNRD
ncbi:MAG: hypothetical protein NTZ44_01935 [Candidatus Nomurabacteria bacterium]|nr:hypothetical protein [Candidatus Nomurabacteria bacterium]